MGEAEKHQAGKTTDLSTQETSFSHLLLVDACDLVVLLDSGGCLLPGILSFLAAHCICNRRGIRTYPFGYRANGDGRRTYSCSRLAWSATEVARRYSVVPGRLALARSLGPRCRLS